MLWLWLVQQIFRKQNHKTWAKTKHQRNSTGSTDTKSSQNPSSNWWYHEPLLSLKTFGRESTIMTDHKHPCHKNIYMITKMANNHYIWYKYLLFTINRLNKTVTRAENTNTKYLYSQHRNKHTGAKQIVAFTK